MASQTENGSATRIVHFYRELQRRRLVRTAVIYSIAAWGVVAACDVLLPQIVAQAEMAMRLVFLAIALAFPVVLIFSWFYDVTEKGIQRTPSFSKLSHDPDTNLHRYDYTLVALLTTLVIAIVAVTAIHIRQLPDALPTSTKSLIAVLPFTLCHGYLGDDLSAHALENQVIDRLIESGKVLVVSHGTSYIDQGRNRQKGFSTQTPAAQYVLKGELCRSAANLALTVTLSDNRGVIVLKDRIERPITNGDQNTLSLASLAVANINGKLGGNLLITGDAPVDPLAFEQLQIGRQWLEAGDDEMAQAAFRRALQLQPDFPEAEFELALLELGSPVQFDQGTGVRNAWPLGEEALAMVVSRLERGGGSSRAYFIAGRISAALARWDMELAWRQSHELDVEEIVARRKFARIRFEEAEEYLATSLALNPESTETYIELADAIEQQGLERRDEALAVLQQGRSRDPLNIMISARVAKRLAARGQFWQAIEMLQRFDDLPHVPSAAWWWQLEMQTLQGYWDEKCETLIKMLLHDPGAFENHDNRWQAWWFLSQLAYLGLYDEAEAWRIHIESMPLEPWAREVGRRNYLLALGRNEEIIRETRARLAAMNSQEILDAYHEWGIIWAHGLALAGEFEPAIELMESVRYAPSLWQERETNPSLKLSALYKKVGRDQEAEALLATVVSHLEAEIAIGIRHPDSLATLAFAYAHQGNDDDAIDMLQRAVNYHWRGPCDDGDELAWYWPFGRLSNNPRLIAICERIEADLSQQALRVRSMLAQHEFDELLAPLIAMALDPHHL